MSQKFFYSCLGISLVIHVLLLALLSFDREIVKPKPFKTITVTYRDLKPKPESKPKAVLKEANLNTTPKLTKDFTPKERDIKRPFQFHKGVKDLARTSPKIKFEKKLTPQIKTLDLGRKITVPIFQSEKISNPKYLSYNENIRQRIKEHAYTFIDHPNFSPGQVYLTFIIAADGVLQGINVIDEKTSASFGLKDIGRLSIKESSPFPPFPDDLKYPELTFNVVVSFEVDE